MRVFSAQKFICINMDVRVTVILCFLCSLPGGYGYASGAPESRCQTMQPDHGTGATYRHASAGGYSINVRGNKTYTPGQSLEVEILANHRWDFKGFLLQARTASDGSPGSEIHGTFTAGSSAGRTACDEGALTHASNSRKDSIVATWTAPEEPVGDIMFIATVVRYFGSVYVRITSDVIEEATVHDVMTMGGPCSENQLEPLPVKLPHVAMLCDDDLQCPCSWKCCKFCGAGAETCGAEGPGLAICRQPHVNTTLTATVDEV